MTATAVGLLVKKRCETARWHIGRIVSIVSGDTVDITELSDGDDWPEEGNGTYDWGIGAKVFRSVPKGTDIGEWQELDDPALAAAIPALLAAPDIPTSLSLTLGAASGVQVSATRPALVVVRGTGAPALSATGTQAFTVQLLVGDTASGPAPSTVIDDVDGSVNATLILGVATTTTMPWKLVAIVPAGKYIRVVQSAGAATTTLTAATKQPL
ncbi:MAG TPA: hypothetical protein VJU58_03985 [Microbacterium sp.]|nr:hypothetical protein [Microbacterium sp.]